LTRSILTCLAAALAAPAARADGNEPVIEDVLQILKDRGIVDESQYTELVAKQQSWEQKNTPLLGRIEFSGDMRLRFENFWYNEDAFGVDQSNRNRLRYRLRLQGKAAINDYIDAVFRLASGEGDPRSTNRTLGADPDFGPDAIFIDRAYLVFKPPPERTYGVKLNILGGKMPNPFLEWNGGPIDLLWDGDINPEGLAIELGYQPTENVKLLLNTGYFIDKENSTHADPHVFGIQGGGIWTPTEKVEVGTRLAFYSWRSLDAPFFGRASASGNVPDGLTEGAPTIGASTYRTGDLALYLRFSGVENWPLLVWGQIAHNFDAVRSELFPGAEKEPTGWGLGFSVGDKKKLALLGLGYYYLGANFWPAQFTDSDLFDGFTNRKGWAFFAQKQVLANTDLALTLFVGDAIHEETAAYPVSNMNANRIRLQTDVIVKF
jgi:hypothetical protein